jgi:hypothetical protein
MPDRIRHQWSDRASTIFIRHIVTVRQFDGYVPERHGRDAVPSVRPAGAYLKPRRKRSRCGLEPSGRRN